MNLAATPTRSKSKPRSTPSKTIAASAAAQMDLSTPSKPTPRRKPKSVTSPPSMSPATPSTVRRSRRLLETPAKPTPTLKRKRAAPSPKTPTQAEPKRQRRQPKKRSYYRKVAYGGGEFSAGDDVYVKRREGAESDAEDPEEEECRVCFRAGGGVMVECDVCLGGFHLRCVRPPLRRVPEGDWACTYCEAERAGRAMERPKPPVGKSLKRTAKEKLLSSDLWAARIEREMEEISAFVKDAICNDQCLGCCLYIHGVPGTGKTMSVLAVMRRLRFELDSGALRPYCFIEINGLKLATPENIYKVIYEQLSGHRIGWKKTLHYLTEHFLDGTKIGKQAKQPIVLLIDELDLLLTRNQSVIISS